MGHLESERVVDLAKQRFYWPKMVSDIENFIRKKCKCTKDKKPNVPEKAALVNIKRYAQAFLTKNNRAKTAADKIFNDVVIHFRFPRQIHHDQGGEFNNKIWIHLQKSSGVKATRTTPYHPMGNGQCERMNRALLNMLKTLDGSKKNNWKDHVYNNTKHKSTEYSPHYLMFGRTGDSPLMSCSVSKRERSLVHIKTTLKKKLSRKNILRVKKNCKIHFLLKKCYSDKYRR